MSADGPSEVPGDASPGGGPVDDALRALARPRGNRLWDAFLRGTGLAGVLGIACLLLFPASGPLIGLGIFALWITGPLSPLFPVGLELVVMAFGRLHDPWLVAAVVMAAGLYGEFISWHLYGHVVGLEMASGLRSSRAVTWARGLFRRRPFLASWICAWSPLPFWIVRILGPLTGYPLWKALVANFLGRYPKLWLFAALGLYVPVPDEVLWIAVGVGLPLGLAVALYRRYRSGAEEDGDAGADPRAGVTDPRSSPRRPARESR